MNETLAESNDARAILHREKTFHCFVSCSTHSLQSPPLNLMMIRSDNMKEIKIDHYETTSIESYVKYLQLYFESSFPKTGYSIQLTLKIKS